MSVAAQHLEAASRPYAPGRARRVGVRRAWRAAAVVIALLVVLPSIGVALSLLTPSSDVWRLLWETRLAEMLASTLVLMFGVIAGTLVLGGGLAWLTGLHRFPGHRVLSWLLVLPLAMPAYVLGFVAVGLLDAPGPVQQALRSLTGAEAALFNPRSMFTAIMVFSLALYPYVYLLARAALAEQSPVPYEVARTLGLAPAAAARRVLLPLARPALAAGAALVAMETLTDFATVQYFNVETVSVGVERVWHGMYERGAAAELASTVLLIAALIIGGERVLRGRARYEQRGRGGGLEPIRLRGRAAAMATAACTLVLTLAFVIPTLQLVLWSRSAALRTSDGGFDGRYLTYLGNSALLAVVTAAVCAIAGLVLVNAARLSADRLTPRLTSVANLGYALPGPVIAIGTLLLLAGVDRALDAAGIQLPRAVVTGSLFTVVYAYGVRFLALASNSLEAGLQRVSSTATMSALTLGAKPRRVAARIHLPQLRSGLGVALVLVAIDALKELPIVLLLRPFGFETLSLWVFRSAAEARWELAGPAALTIVAVAAIPVVTLFRSHLRVHDLAASGGEGIDDITHATPAIDTGRRP